MELNAVPDSPKRYLRPGAVRDEERAKLKRNFERVRVMDHCTITKDDLEMVHFFRIFLKVVLGCINAKLSC